MDEHIMHSIGVHSTMVPNIMHSMGVHSTMVPFKRGPAPRGRAAAGAPDYGYLWDGWDPMYSCACASMRMYAQLRMG